MAWRDQCGKTAAAATRTRVSIRPVLHLTAGSGDSVWSRALVESNGFTCPGAGV